MTMKFEARLAWMVALSLVTGLASADSGVDDGLTEPSAAVIAEAGERGEMSPRCRRRGIDLGQLAPGEVPVVEASEGFLTTVSFSGEDGSRLQPDSAMAAGKVDAEVVGHLLGVRPSGRTNSSVAVTLVEMVLPRRGELRGEVVLEVREAAQAVDCWVALQLAAE